MRMRLCTQCAAAPCAQRVMGLLRDSWGTKAPMGGGARHFHCASSEASGGFLNTYVMARALGLGSLASDVISPVHAEGAGQGLG